MNTAGSSEIISSIKNGYTPAPLDRTDIARLWRETTGGVRMSQTDEEFARRIERAAIEAYRAEQVAANNDSSSI